MSIIHTIIQVFLLMNHNYFYLYEMFWNYVDIVDRRCNTTIKHVIYFGEVWKQSSSINMCIRFGLYWFFSDLLLVYWNFIKNMYEMQLYSRTQRYSFSFNIVYVNDTDVSSSLYKNFQCVLFPYTLLTVSYSTSIIIFVK